MKGLSVVSPSSAADGQEVLQAMRGYVQFFFGCRDCAHHFEQMAAASMHHVRSPRNAVLWLWTSHNRVNARLSGKVTSKAGGGIWGHTDCLFQWRSTSHTYLPALLARPVCRGNRWGLCATLVLSASAPSPAGPRTPLLPPIAVPLPL